MTADIVDIRALSQDADEVAQEDAFLVDLEGYEGPLHLLLDMARRQKVDLLEISILDLAKQYLEFIEDAKTKRIDLAADYLLMAAWLTYLKSRLLLPKMEKSADGEDEPEDMAQRLAFRLKRLDAMREAGEALMDGPLLDNVVFLRGAPEQPRVIKKTEYATSLYELTQAFGSIRARKEAQAPHRVVHQFVLPLEKARESLREILPSIGDWASLETVRAQMLQEDGDLPPRSATASVFSATLELARDGDVDLRQDAHFTPLYLKGLMGPAADGETL